MPALTLDPEGVHDRQVGIEGVHHGLVRSLVLHMALGVGDGVVRIPALGQGLPAALDHADLGLLVVPEDLEGERDRGGAGEDEDSERDAQRPRAPVGRRVLGGAPDVAALQEGDRDRDGRGGEERSHRELGPLPVEGVVGGEDGDPGEEGADGVEAGVACLG